MARIKESMKTTMLRALKHSGGETSTKEKDIKD